MYASQIQELLPHCHVLARDELPYYRLKRPCSIVANTDPAHLPGKHWVAIYLPRHCAAVEFFDSYGISPRLLHDDFNTFCALQGHYTRYNDKCLQHFDSQVCAHFCLYFLYSRHFGRPFEDLMLDFSTYDKFSNERRVFDFVYRLHSVL